MDKQRIVEFLNELRDDGYAAVVFSPEEIPEGKRIDTLEEVMIERGWFYLDEEES